MGPVGSGLVAKMINQLIVGCGHAVMAEALLLAESAGIDAARIPECLSGGHADRYASAKAVVHGAAFAPQGYASSKDREMVNTFAGGLKVPVLMAGEVPTVSTLIDRGDARRARHGRGIQALRHDFTQEEPTTKRRLPTRPSRWSRWRQ